MIWVLQNQRKLLALGLHTVGNVCYFSEWKGEHQMQKTIMPPHYQVLFKLCMRDEGLFSLASIAPG